MFRTTGRALRGVLGAALGGALLVGVLATEVGAKTTTVKVEISDDGCPAKLTTTAGPTRFKVSNTGSGDVSEFEILSGSKVVGEVENVAPGLNKQFSMTLKPGKYTTLCPGGSRDKGKLVVKAQQPAS